MESIQLKVTSPPLALPGIDAAIRRLLEFEAIQKRISSMAPITIPGLQGAVGQIGQISDYSKILADRLRGIGQGADVSKVTTGFKGMAEEVSYLNGLVKTAESNIGQLQRRADARTNPVIGNTISGFEGVSAAARQRLGEIGAATSDVAVQAQFAAETRAIAQAEAQAAAAAGKSTAALGAQNEVVLSKTKSMGGLAASAQGVVAAEGQVGVATRETAAAQGLLQQRYLDGDLIESKYRTGVGQTQRVLLGEQKTIVDTANHVEILKAKFQDIARQGTINKSSFPLGSPEHVQAIRNEVAAIDAQLVAMKALKLESDPLYRAQAQRSATLGGQATRLEGSDRIRALRAEQQAEEALQRQRSAALIAEQKRQQVAETALQRQRSRARLEEAERDRAERRASGVAGQFDTARGRFTGEGVKEVTTRTTTVGGVTETTQLQKEIDGKRQAATMTRQYDAEGRLLNATLAEQGRTLEKNTNTMQGTIGGTVLMAAKFIAVYRALDLVIQGFSAGINASIEFERKLATLSVIFRGTREQSRELAVSAMQMASAFGQDGVAAVQVATDFARFGGSQAEVLEAVRVVSLAANVAEISLEESSHNFQAIMASFQIGTGGLNAVLGSLNTISNTYQVTVKQLLDGLARVGPVAKQAGVSLNEVLGFEAVISGRTGRPGAEAGVAVKSLLSRLTKPAVQESLVAVGVSARDQSGELKNESQVINELFVALQGLDGAQKQYLLTQVAGTQQVARISALFDGYVKTQLLAIAASRDLTSSDRENAARRSTLASQLGTLSTEWQRFWVAGAGAGQAAGVQSAITNLVKLMSSLLSVLTVVETGLPRLGSAAQEASKKILGDRAGGVATGLGKAVFSSLIPSNDFAAGIVGGVEAIKKSPLGDMFTTDLQKAQESLREFNAEVDRLKNLADADEAASRLVKTLAKLVPTAGPEKLAEIARAVAEVSQPNNLPAQEAMRAQIVALGQAGDKQGILTRFAELAGLLEFNRLQRLKETNRELDAGIQKETERLNVLRKQRDEAAGRDDKETAKSKGLAIDQAESTLEQLRARKTGNYKKLFEEGDDLGEIDPTFERRLQARAQAIGEVSKAYPASTSKVVEIDRELAAIAAQRVGMEKEIAAARKDSSTFLAADKERDRLAALEAELRIQREYAALQDRITEGTRIGTIQVEQYKIGRNETEQSINEARGITREALPEVRRRIDGAANDLDRAQAQAQGMQLINQLNLNAESVEARRLKLKAQYINKQREENVEASKALQTASREDQLRAALIAKFTQSRGRGFSADEFQFLNKETRDAAEKFVPQVLPTTFGSAARDIKIELGEAEQFYKRLRAEAAAVALEFGKNLVTSPVPAAPAAAVPVAFTAPPVSLQFSDQFGEMIAVMTDAVRGPLQQQISDMRSQVNTFLAGSRLAGAQAAGTSAV